MSHEKSIGTIWEIGATYILATTEKTKYQVFLDKAGHILIVDDEKEAPDTASYVRTIDKAINGGDPVLLAARLAYVATGH